MRELEFLAAEPRVLGTASLHPSMDPAHNRVGGLIDLLRTLPRLGLVVEVGSDRGVSAETLLHFCRHLVCVDPWPDGRARREWDARLGDHGSASYLRMPSLDAAGLFADGAADLVYLDADHHYECVLADVRAWLPKVRPGGWLAGHDHSPAVDGGGVIRAVAAVCGGPHAVFGDTSWLVHLPPPPPRG